MVYDGVCVCGYVCMCMCICMCTYACILIYIIIYIDVRIFYVHINENLHVLYVNIIMCVYINIRIILDLGGSFGI